MIHELKILPHWFNDVQSGIKNFEIRRNDRDFHVGDWLILKEYERGKYTGRFVKRQIQYIYQGDGTYGLSEEFCILGLQSSAVTINMTGNNATQIGYIHEMRIE